MGAHGFAIRFIHWPTSGWWQHESCPLKTNFPMIRVPIAFMSGAPFTFSDDPIPRIA